MPETGLTSQESTVIQAVTTIHDWLIPVGAVLILAILTGLLVFFRPAHIALVRINLIWVSTLVAVLTLAFGNRLIGLLTDGPDTGASNTIEIVLSSLVGVGIGGLIAIAGQLVQDSPSSSATEKKEISTTASPANDDSPGYSVQTSGVVEKES